MNVLIADKLEEAARARLRGIGCHVDDRPKTTPDELPDALRSTEADVLIVRSTKVDAAAVAASPRLKLIVRAGAGTDTIDVPAASAAGVFVANCPGRNAAAVAELTWGLILACDRRIPDQVSELRQGRWNKAEYSKAEGLKGRYLGIIGMGTIGQEVARRGFAFGMEVVAWSPSLDRERAEELGVRRAGSAYEVAAQSDVISLHVAATEDTQHLVDDGFLEVVKPGSILINTSRGSVLDEEALAWAVEEKGLRVGLDVYASEPQAGSAAFDRPLLKLPGVFGTHHVGASTQQAQEAIALEAARVVEEFAEIGVPPNCVNRERRAPVAALLTVRHFNRPGVLAKVFRVLGEAEINVEEMDNMLYEGRKAACARIQLAREPSPTELEELQAASEHIVSLEVKCLEDET
jgi:D-3-phosphoglycerate dehydrogenase / 2-oxoglutarate reductase